MSDGGRRRGDEGTRHGSRYHRALTATQDGAQAKGPSQHETGTVTRTEEEASSTERVGATGGEEEHVTQSQAETCTEGERAPAA